MTSYIKRNVTDIYRVFHIIAKDIHAIHQSIEFSLKHATPWKTYTHTNLSYFKNILITPCMPPEYKAIKQNQKQANFQ